MTEKYAFIYMIKEKWWNEFRRLNRLGRTTHCYVQGGWAPPKSCELLFFYVVKPIGEIRGYAKFIWRKVGKKEAMWKKYGNESCLSGEQYDDLMRGRLNVTFVRFTNLWEASKPIPLNNILTILGIDRMSRKGFYIDREAADKLVEAMD